MKAQIAHYAFIIFQLTILSVATIICAYIIYGTFSLLSDRSKIEAGLRVVGAEWIADTIAIDPEEELKNNKEDVGETYDAFFTKNAIAEWIEKCISSVQTTEMKYNTDYHYDEKSDKPRSMSPAIKITPHFLEDLRNQIKYTNDNINNNREVNLMRSAYYYKFWAISTVISILLGLTTTVLVSLASSDLLKTDGRNLKILKTFAIIMPAVGTAFAAIVAFFGPQAEWAQASRTLASFSQIHNQFAMNILKIKCPQSENEDSYTKIQQAVEEASKRILDIQSLTTIATWPKEISSNTYDSKLTPGNELQKNRP